MAVGQFKSYTWDPLLIISQIIAVQAVFYISFGILLYGLNFAVNRDISLLQIFDVTVSVASCLNFVGNIYGSCFFRNKAKGRISKRVSQENKIHLIFWEANISYPLIRTAYQGVRNVCFSKMLVYFVFLWHLFWDWPFYFITDGFFK